MRWPADRFREIEQAAKDLIAWHDEFVGEVKDHLGNDLTAKGSCEWTDVLESLRHALQPIEEPDGKHSSR